MYVSTSNYNLLKFKNENEKKILIIIKFLKIRA